MTSLLTPKYRIVYEVNGEEGGDIWNSRWYGRPTSENLAEWVLWKQNSYQPGGRNAHIGEAYGPRAITAARIETNVPRAEGPRVVAEWKAPITR